MPHAIVEGPPANGYNPMRWNCDLGGPGCNCFNKKKRPKIEMFADCFPGMITMSDVDGVVEVKGNFLYLEWKPSEDISTGQRILIERRTFDTVSTYIIVSGIAETMVVSAYAIALNGSIREWRGGSMADLLVFARQWNDWALRHPRESSRWGARRPVDALDHPFYTTDTRTPGGLVTRRPQEVTP